MVDQVVGEHALDDHIERLPVHDCALEEWISRVIREVNSIDEVNLEEGGGDRWFDQKKEEKNKKKKRKTLSFRFSSLKKSDLILFSLLSTLYSVAD